MTLITYPLFSKRQQRNMENISLLVALIVVSVIVIIVTITTYRAIYQSRINRQLNDENIRRRKLPSPWSFSIITIIVVLIVIAGRTTFLAMNSDLEKVPEEYLNAVYDFKTYNPDEMTHYRSLYSINDNPGYTKQIEQKGDICFTYFIRDDAFDYFHPAFIIFVEYTGDKNILYYGVQGNFFTPSGLNMCGTGHAGSDFKSYFCIIGTVTTQCNFEITAYLYDSTLKRKNMEDYATAYETLTILVPVP